MAWSEWFAILSKPIIGDPKTILPGWSAATFAGDKRKGVNCESLSALVLDYDGGVAINDAVALWSEWFGFLHTTPSYGVDAKSQPRFRIVLPLAGAATPEQFEHVARWAIERARRAGHVDPRRELPKAQRSEDDVLDRLDIAAVADRARLWFMPATHSGRSFHSRDWKGKPLDVDAIVHAAHPQTRTAPRQRTNGAERRSKYVERALEEECERIRTAPDGTQNNAINAAAFSIGQLVAGGEIVEATAREELLAAALAGKHPRRRAETAIASGLAAGMKQPRTVPEPEPDRQRSTTHDDPGDPGTEAPPQRDPAEAPSRGKKQRSQTEHATYPPVVSPAGYLASLTAHTPIATGIPLLDRASDGGLRPETFTIIAGGSTAGKTTLLVTLARALAQTECLVVFLAADEHPRRITVRLAQTCGCDRALLKAGDEYERSRACEAFARELGNVPVLDGAHWTVETAMRWAREIAEGRPMALLVDSLHAAQSDLFGEDDEETKRVRLMSVALRSIADGGAIVVASAEANRRHTAPVAADGDPVPMVAVKGSSKAEYACDMLVVLDAIDGAPTTLCQVPKSRDGETGACTLIRDPAKSLMLAAGGTGSSATVIRRETRAEVKQKRKDTAIDALVEKLVRYIAEHGPLSQNALEAKGGAQRQATRDALERAVLEKRLDRTVGARNARIFSLHRDQPTESSAAAS
jgi:hypothetical protein